ncbi:MAG: cupin domain-containing protein [Mariniblastus sp.]
MTKPTRLTVSYALEQLCDHSEPFKKLFGHGSLEIEIYKPDQVDNQTPHSRDEIYVIASGSGCFINGDVQHEIEVGEVLFVPAGVEHRFVDFTDDFSTWVFFYGPEGGEAI